MLRESTSAEAAIRTLHQCIPVLKRLPPAFHRDALLAVFKSLALHGDLQVLRHTLDATLHLFKLEIKEELHAAVVDGLLQGRHHTRAIAWLRDMTNFPEARCVNIKLWNHVFESCLTCEQYPLVWKSMRHIQDTPFLKPDVRTYSLYFQAIFFRWRPGTPPLAFIQSSLERMKADDIPLSDDILQALLHGYNSVGDRFTAARVQRVYARLRGSKSLHDSSGGSTKSADINPVKPALDPNAEDTISAVDATFCSKKLASLLATRRDNVARRVLTQMLSAGFRPTSSTLDDLAPYLRDSKALAYWEGALDVSASRIAWSIILRNAAEADTTETVLATYRELLDRKLVPSSADISCVLMALCSSKIRPPTDSAIREAIHIFREYVKLTSELEDHLVQDDLPAYNILIRALCYSMNLEFHAVAVSMLEDLHARGLSVDSETTRSFIILFMRVAPDADMAFRFYRKMYRSPDGKVILDQKGFEAVLNTFCELCLNQGQSSGLYLAIVRDMRLAGYGITAVTYTILLRRLSHLLHVARRDRALTAELAASVRRVHNTITVDPTLQPDTALWNQLMDTYQRAGCFHEAYGIWETLYLSQQLDNTSVSVILDACGYAGAAALAINTFAKVYESGFKLNQRNWETWIECLCRLGRLDDAVKVLCLALPKEKAKGEGVHPTRAMAKHILQIAANQGRQDELRARIRAVLPRLV